MLSDYIHMILRRWWLALLPVAVVAAFTVATYRPPGVTYQTTLRFAAGLPPERTSGVYNYDRQYVWLASEYIANGLADIVRTSLFAQHVAERVNTQDMNVSPGQVQGALTADQSQSIVVVYLSWPDAAQCERIGNAVIAELTERGASYWPQLADTNATPVVALDRPAPAPVAVSLRDRLDLPVRFVLALAAGLALVLLAHYVDPVIRERREVERMGFAVVGEIPKA
jgi:capsular polysaccharide biosynthesis protein